MIPKRIVYILQKTHNNHSLNVLYTHNLKTVLSEYNVKLNEAIQPDNYIEQWTGGEFFNVNTQGCSILNQFVITMEEHKTVWTVLEQVS